MAAMAVARLALGWRRASGLLAAGLQVSEPRAGRKPGTRVMSLYSGTCGIHTLILEKTPRAAE